jgi:uncharacterized protein (DUF362 family)
MSGREITMDKISRREFLRLAAAGLGTVMGGQVLAACSQTMAPQATSTADQAPAAAPPTPTSAPVLPTATQPAAPARPIQVGSSTVSVVQSACAECKDIQVSDIQGMVRQAVDLAGGLQDIIQDGQTVVLKPNLYGKVYQVNGEPLAPEASGLVTDWRVTRAVVELVRELNPSGNVYVMEGSCLGSTAEIFQHLQYTAANIPGVDDFIAIESDSGAWQDTASPGLVKVDVPDGLWKSSYYLNRKYQEADVVISLPVLKNHSYSTISGAVKNVAIGASPANIYGKSATDDNRYNSIPHDKVNFHKWVRDYYRCRPVEFAIVDGLQGIQNGPMCYDERCDLLRDQMNMRLILAGRDALAVDTILGLVMGWDPESVEYLQLLNAASLGTLDTAAITVAGQPVDGVRKDFAGPAPVCGGSKVSDKRPPTLSIEKAAFLEGKLSLTLMADEKTNKAEIYVDDRLQGTVLPPDFQQAVVDAGNISPGTHAVKVWAYDRFLNRSEQMIKADL